MTEKPTVSHEHLDRAISALNSRVAAHERHMNTVTGKIFDKVDEVSGQVGKAIEASHANSLQIATLQGTFTSIMESRVDHVSRLHDAEKAIVELKNSASQRDGERSVWTGLARSPIIMLVLGGVAGAAAALWTAIKAVSAHVPMVTLALLVTATLAGATLAKPVTVVSVHDGDTLSVKGQWAVIDGRKVLFRVPGQVNVRLLGIDTPEMGARAKCQAERDAADRARDNLRAMAIGKADIGLASHDKYGGRLLADITVNGVSLSAAQIAGGFAGAYSGEGPKRNWCEGVANGP
jgi:micrococcal nuclease